MATIRNRLGKIHMFTQGRDLGIPKYLAEKGLDVNVEYVRNGIDDGMLAIEAFETKEVKIRVSVEREELDRLMKDMDNVNKLANEVYDKIRKLSKIKIEY